MMIKIKLCFAVLIPLLVLTTSCTRTPEDVAKWKDAGNIEKLVGALGDPKTSIRKGAAEALGELKATESSIYLGELLDDEKEVVQESAIQALVNISDETSLQQVMNVIPNLTNTELQVIAINALGEHKIKKAIPALSSLLDSSTPEVSTAAAKALGPIGNEAVSKLLVEKLSVKSKEMRIAIANSLGQIKGEAAIEGLISILDDKRHVVGETIIHALEEIGEPVVAPVSEHLKHQKKVVRQRTIRVLRELDSIPTTGENFTWFLLATEANKGTEKINLQVIKRIRKKDKDVIDTLIEASAHSNKVIRAYANRTLEEFGTVVLEKTLAAAEEHAKYTANQWMNQRAQWQGSPSKKIDLWAATAVLNPKFSVNNETILSMKEMGRIAFNTIKSPDFELTDAYIPYLINLLGDNTTPPPPAPEFDQDGIPVVRKAVDRFRGTINQKEAIAQLSSYGSRVVFPLIAALSSDSMRIKNNAASILSALNDKRAIKPIMATIEKMLKTDITLSNTDLYNALIHFNDEQAEPILKLIRPNTERAMQVFERKYGVKVNLCEPIRRDVIQDAKKVTFRLGFIYKKRVEEFIFSFERNQYGLWLPEPPLTDEPSFK